MGTEGRWLRVEKAQVVLLQKACKGGRKAGQWAEGSGLKETLFLPGRQEQMLRWKGRSSWTAMCALYVPLVLSPGISDSRQHIQHVLLAQTDSSLSPHSGEGVGLPASCLFSLLMGVAGRGLDCLETSPAPRLPSECSRPRAVLHCSLVPTS